MPAKRETLEEQSQVIIETSHRGIAEGCSTRVRYYRAEGRGWMWMMASRFRSGSLFLDMYIAGYIRGMTSSSCDYPEALCTRKMEISRGWLDESQGEWSVALPIDRDVWRS